MAKRKSIFKGILLFIGLTALVFLVTVTVRTTYTLSRHSEGTRVLETKVGELEGSEMDLREKLVNALGESKRFSRRNRQLEEAAEQFESEKAIILSQVRDSMSGFADFRKGSAIEIAKLTMQLEDLEIKKTELTDRIESVSGEAAMDKAVMTDQATALNEEISEQKKSVMRFEDQLKRMEKQEIIIEAAKLHYNIGNFYFRHQKYDHAVEEYKKSLIYQPDDADTHFNLAVVSDEHLKDRGTAIRHYKKYLSLNPNDENLEKVESRILDLELRHNVMIGSPLKEFEEDLKDGLHPL